MERVSLYLFACLCVIYKDLVCLSTIHQLDHDVGFRNLFRSMKFKHQHAIPFSNGGRKEKCQKTVNL